MLSAKEKEYIQAVNGELVDLAKNITVLSALSWPDRVQKEFFAELEKGNYTLPKGIAYKIPEDKERLRELKKLTRCIGESNPALFFLRETAESYYYALMMVQGAGTEAVTEYSIQLYGRPDDPLPDSSGRTNLDAAKHFLSIAATFKTDLFSRESRQELSAEEFKEFLEFRIQQAFAEDEIKVLVDPNKVSRVSVSGNAVNIRANAKFTRFEAEQLLHHEVFTHALTSINGRQQPYLNTLGYAAPRTTMTQEGLATFSELMTGYMDVDRLKRIALRIIAIDMALNGADFIELFKFFRFYGQSQEESYLSSMRIMRGGKPEGGIVFTKDNVYLRGLIEVNNFFLHSLQENNLDKLEVLFAGKLTTGDVEMLYPFMQEGIIQKPRYVPGWFTNSHGLAAQLAFHLFHSNTVPPAAV